MSEENVGIVGRGYDVYNRGDLKGFVAPEATFHPLPYGTESTRHGREEILDLLSNIRAPLERNEAVAEKIVEGRDQVVTRHAYRGVVKGTEDVVEARIGLAITLRAGEITGIRAFRTFDEALEAAGMSE